MATRAKRGQFRVYRKKARGGGGKIRITHALSQAYVLSLKQVFATIRLVRRIGQK